MSWVKLISVLFLSSFFLSGCVGAGTSIYIPGDRYVKQKPYKKQGPPPHAPAHGYRQKHHHGVDLKFDAGLGAYLVVKFPGIYFHNGLYSRISPKGAWLVAPRFDGPWRVAVKGDVPQKLKKNKGKKKGKKDKKNR
ncbi:MAG: hypothetical protein H8E79_03480 [Desulfobulbaceae bacterium]|uniref:Lipoprotein n=1 Tax=Candidatus Desulfatifera sulfidica TaxID=2841691 RepID=A0A8J6N8Z5_9BACT|nr:hypothetical protein [Candidatus Desulfatifera sulfidica]